MAVINPTNLANSDANKAYYETEIAEAATLSASRTALASYYQSPTPARWMSLTSEMVEDGVEIRAGEISRAFEGHAPRPFLARDKRGREGLTTAIASNVDDPDRRAATDITVSQPKSFSALVRCAELAGEEDLVRMLRQAKESAIRATFKHAIVDLGLIRTRRGHGGKESEVPRDIMLAIVPHARSRAGDAQEHDHVLAFNGGLREDGTVGTLDLSAFVTHKFYLQAAIGADLAKRVQALGFAIKQTSRGQWEIAGAPQELLETWSKGRKDVLENLSGVAGDLARRQAEAERQAAAGEQIDESIADLPTIGRNKTQAKREAKQASALKSRRAKSEMEDAAELETKDRREIAECTTREGVPLNLTPESVIAAMQQATPLTPIPEGQPLEAAVEFLYTRTSVATLRQFRTAVAEAAAARGMAVADIEAEVQRGITSGAVRVIGTTTKGEAVLSTDAAIQMERSFLTNGLDGRGQGRLTLKSAETAMAQVVAEERTAGNSGFAYSEEQENFIRWFARGDRVVVGTGRAGAGKTTAMKVVVRAAHLQGMHTIGVAPTNSAAETLHKETGTREYLSIQKLAMQLRAGQRKLSRNDYILVDEAGMAELGDAAVVVAAATKAGAQVGFVGDARQFAPIGAGSPFEALGRVLGNSELGEIRRQRVEWQLQASLAMAQGDIDAGLMAYAAEGRWTFGRNSGDAMDKLVADWTADLARLTNSTGEPASRLVIAQKNEDVHALNERLRQVLIDTGRLGSEEVTVQTLHRDGRDGEVKDLRLRVGDQLVAWRTIPQHNLNNGDRITITAVSPIPGKAGDAMLTWRTEKTGIETTAPLSSMISPKGPDDPPSLPRIPFLQHAYALTQYASQGKTVGKSFIYGGVGLDFRALYVALTRHRDDAQIYWDRGGIAQNIRDEGDSPTRANVVEYLRREARRMTDKLNCIDFARDVDAWLKTGDITAERPAESPVAARMRAAGEHAAATIRAAMAQPDHAEAVTMAAAQQPEMPQPKPPRVPAEKRADAAFQREVARRKQGATVQDRRHLRQYDTVIQAFTAPGGAARLVASFRAAPRRLREDLVGAAERAIPNLSETVSRWRHAWEMRRQAAHLDARRTELDRANRAGGIRGLSAVADAERRQPTIPDRASWKDSWMRAARVGPYSPAAATVQPSPVGRAEILARLPRLPGDLAQRLDTAALAALAQPRLGASPADAPTISAAAYAATLERDRAITEQRAIEGLAAWSGKAPDVVARQLEEALARPDRIQHQDLRIAVDQIRALAQARDEVRAAIKRGQLRAGAPILALDPYHSPAAWRGEIHKAQKNAEDHTPRADRARDQSIYDGTRITVREAVAVLRAHRAALGLPPEGSAPAGSAGETLDGAIATLREAVTEGRLSARAPINLVSPADRTGWRVAFRNAAYETARMAGANQMQARTHGRQADAASFDALRQSAEVQQSVQARDANAALAERGLQAAIEAMKAAEQTTQTAKARPTSSMTYGS